MKKLFGCVCVCQVLVPVLLVLCTIAGVKANNIRVDGKTRVVSFVGTDTAVVEVNLRWDNSWRDDFNWDAAWVFFKFKKRGLENPWQHAYLSSSGHVLTPGAGNEGGGYAYMVGANGGKVNGLYIMRNGISEGNVSVRLQVKWCLSGTGLTKSDFGDALNGVYVAVHGIEMVYIPYNSYYLGDGVSNLCFHEAYGTERNPIRLNGYKSISASSVYQNSYPAEYAIDNNINTHYHSAGNSDEWFMIDFGSKKEMRHFTIRTHYSGTGYYLEGSNDGSSWSTLWSGNGSAWSTTQSKHKITNPGAYQYYRFRETGNYLVIYDVALWEQEVPVLRIDSEEPLYYSVARNTLTERLQLPAAYPKGYAGFYIMKYETSQEQYVEFLNSLTLEQQKARVMNNSFSAMKKGDYVFGDLKTPNCRNGIAFVEQKQSHAPVVFGNNLNPGNDFFSTDDGQTLACNYMSVEDMLAYCSWSGLRPMSELEYEKACRRPYPQIPAEREYAWNSNTGVNSLNSLGDLAYAGAEREQANSAAKNVNSGVTNQVNGPVRCGLFATSSSSQAQSGATYWGVMEMSGNLKELCANVNYTAFDGGSCGTGEYNASYWNTAVGSYGVRGGGFSSHDSLLRTSDRSEAMNYFTAITQRDSTVGFRGVYNMSGMKIDGGEIRALQDTVCPGGEAEIVNVKEAFCADLQNVRFQYNWYVKKPGEAQYVLIENATGASLTYEDFENTTSGMVAYQFKRVGICSIGETFTTITLTVSAPIEILAQPQSTDRHCDFFILNVNVKNGNTVSYQWQKDGVDIVGATNSTYMKSPTTITDVGNYRCVIKRGSCVMYSETVMVANVPDVNTLTDVRDGKTYPAVKIGQQCWMGKNLNYGVINNTKYCYNNQESNCNQYGGMYTWYMAMNNAPATSEGVPGICPSGWHLPSRTEWETLRQNWDVSWNLEKGGHWIDSQRKFRSLGVTGGWWATQSDNYGGISSNGNAPYHWYDYAYGIAKGPSDWNSVRCIKTK